MFDGSSHQFAVNASVHHQHCRVYIWEQAKNIQRFVGGMSSENVKLSGFKNQLANRQGLEWLGFRNEDSRSRHLKSRMRNEHGAVLRIRVFNVAPYIFLRLLRIYCYESRLIRQLLNTGQSFPEGLWP